MDESIFDNLSVYVRKTEAGDSYQFGVMIYDAFLPFAAFKAGGFEDDLHEAQAAQQAAQQAAANPQPAPASPAAPTSTSPLPPTTAEANAEAANAQPTAQPEPQATQAQPGATQAEVREVTFTGEETVTSPQPPPAAQ